MFNRCLQFVIYLFISFPIHAGQSNSHLTINLEKNYSTEERAQWFVEYKSEKKVRRIFFNNSSNFSRAARWSSLSKEFEIIVEGDQEIIRRKDNGEFDHAKFQLTPSYIHIPKNYAPFSPLSDGGMIFNSGRFFACVQICSKVITHWKLSVNVPPNEHIVVNGIVVDHTASWLDTQNGQSIYVGTQQPVLSSGVLTLIDQGLPTEIRNSLDKDIPKLMKYFETKLGKLEGKDTPTLFASYSNRPGTSSQGGVLPNQIFMHWDFDDLEKKVRKQEFLNETLFYFAHEVAHFFQTPEASAPNEEAWVHEGSADFFALGALAALYPDAENFILKKQLDARNRCETSLNNRALSEASAKGDFKAHYSCGLLIHQRITKEIAKTDGHTDLNALWQSYRKEVQSGKEAGQETFLEILSHYSSHDFSNKIETFINNKPQDPSLTLSQLNQ